MTTEKAAERKTEIARLLERLNKLEWNTDPYEYSFLDNVFSENFYSEILENILPDSHYRKHSPLYKKRVVLNAYGSDFWTEVLSEFNSHERTRAQVCRDFPGYSIGPHTDGPREYITALIYLTDREIKGVGTSLYVPKIEGFTSDGKKHLKFADFTRFAIAPYKPNSGFAFRRSDNSFHGVEPVGIVRNILQVSIYKKGI